MILVRFFTELLSDNKTNKFSQAKTISVLVAIIASLIMIKLTLMSGMSIEYFIAYLAYGTGHANMSKFLDSRTRGKTSE